MGTANSNPLSHRRTLWSTALFLAALYLLAAYHALSRLAELRSAVTDPTAQDLMASLNLGLWSALIVGAALAALLAWIGRTRVALLLSELGGHFGRIADGDLSRGLSGSAGTDMATLATSFNPFVERLRTTIRHFSEVSDEVSAAAGDVYLDADETARGTAKQSAGIEESAQALQRMSGSIAEVAGHAATVVELSTRAESLAHEGEEVVREAAAAMDEVRGSSEASVSSVEELRAQSGRIGDIVDTIKDIADQTNLLALNAAIEAARAGEQGRGFAVVADEVRNLAAKTTHATGEITGMIVGVRDGTERVAESMRRAAAGVQAGVERIRHAGTALTDIAGMSSEVTNKNIEIATAIESQAFSADEISTTIQELAGVAQQLADLGKRNATIAERLANDISAELSGIMERFRLGENVEKYSREEIEKILAEAPPMVNWRDEMSVGVQEFDDHHGELVRLLNRLYGAMQRRLGNEVIGPLLDELVRYTRYHFDAEEALMKRHQYPEPGHGEHVRAHQHLVKEALELQRRFQSGATTINLEVMNFLRKWLVEHIKGTDQKYGAFFNARGVH